MATDEKKFAELYDEFSDSIFRHCCFRVGDRERARDIMQETFVKAWVHVSDGGIIDNHKAFLYTIANNLIIDWYRKKKETSLDKLQAEGFDPGNNEHVQMSRSVEYGRVLRVLDKLDPIYRDVIVMSYVDDMPNKEIAQVLGETENNIAVRIHRAVQKLKLLINDYDERKR
jgi:RNA polymerase sigma-70 factor (ECF subfamily)